MQTEGEWTSLFPPHERYLAAFHLWETHERLAWSSQDTKVQADSEQLSDADPKLQAILLDAVACLHVGDSVVLDVLGTSNALQSITVEPVKAFLASQQAREYVHKTMYSKMLEVSPLHAEHYRSAEYVNDKMRMFVDFAKSRTIEGACAEDSLAMAFFTIMLCEAIMFVPMFHIICYVSSLGFAPRLGKVNKEVMKDEDLHYRHARWALSSLENKLEPHVAAKLLQEMCAAVEAWIDAVLGDYDDGELSAAVCKAHFRHRVHTFRRENGLYTSGDVAPFDKASAHLYRESPASCMLEPLLEVKTNQMECKSSTYDAYDPVSEVSTMWASSQDAVDKHVDALFSS